MSRGSEQRAIEAAVGRDQIPGVELRRATVITGGGTPTVLIDGANSPRPAQPTADIPSAGMRVLVTYALNGAVLITDILGGAWRNLGSTTYNTAQTGITTEVALDGLSLDITVPYPGRLLIVHAKVFVETSSVASTTPVLRVREDDVSGAVVGSIIDESPLLVTNDNQCLQGETMWVTPDDDEYTLVMTLANGGAGTVDTLTTAARLAEFRVYDAGFYLPDVGP